MFILWQGFMLMEASPVADKYNNVTESRENLVRS